jgi:hypothetical protein
MARRVMPRSAQEWKLTSPICSGERAGRPRDAVGNQEGPDADGHVQKVGSPVATDTGLLAGLTGKATDSKKCYHRVSGQEHGRRDHAEKTELDASNRLGSPAPGSHDAAEKA